jgi:hypothetical protein
MSTNPFTWATQLFALATQRRISDFVRRIVRTRLQHVEIMSLAHCIFPSHPEV